MRDAGQQQPVKINQEKDSFLPYHHSLSLWLRRHDTQIPQNCFEKKCEAKKYINTGDVKAYIWYISSIMLVQRSKWNIFELIKQKKNNNLSW